MTYIQLDMTRDVDVAVVKYMIKNKSENKKVAAARLFHDLVISGNSDVWEP